MFKRLALTAAALPLLFPLSTIAAETTNVEIPQITVEAPKEIPCKGTGGRTRARCITDTLKLLQKLNHEYGEEVKLVTNAWKKAHAHMGVSNEYQRLLRAFLADIHADRKVFKALVQDYRREFFAEQKLKTKEENAKNVKNNKKLDAKTFEDAKAKCGKPDDDGAYRMCLRLQLRTRPSNVDRRSRTAPRANNL